MTSNTKLGNNKPKAQIVIGTGAVFPITHDVDIIGAYISASRASRLDAIEEIEKVAKQYRWEYALIEARRRLGELDESDISKATVFRWLWDQGKRLYQKVRGERIEQIIEPTPITRDRFLARPEWGKAAEDINGSLFRGESSIQRWQLDFRNQLRRSYIDQYMLAKGGRQNMTQSDWGRVGAMLKGQYQYMDRFAAQLASGEIGEKQAAQRMKMYFDSARQSFEKGKQAARGMPDLPAYPGDGSTQCLSNCACSWAIQETETEWLATWTLGPTEHCDDCDARSRDWAPLRLPK